MEKYSIDVDAEHINNQVTRKKGDDDLISHYKRPLAMRKTNKLLFYICTYICI